MALVAKLRSVSAPNRQIWQQFIVSYMQRVNYSDAIESFTAKLVTKTNKQEKSKSSWTSESSFPVRIRKLRSQGDLQLVKKTTQQLLKEINSIYDSLLCVDVRKMPKDQLDVLFLNSIDVENRTDLNLLVNECMRWDVLPAPDTNLEILQFYATTNQWESHEKFYHFCLEHTENILPLKLYTVKCYWTEGNTDKSLRLLDEIHMEASKSDQASDLLACKDMFLYLISDVVGSKSEAVLRKLILLIETLDDVGILERVWNELFISEWFSDQQLATGLFRRHAALRLKISVQTNYVTFLLLREHNIDAVYRLVELLLSHDMMNECQKVLGLLFDYQFWRKDLRTCSEIIQTCISLDIPLDPNYGRKLVMLLLAPKTTAAHKVRDGKKPSPPNVEFKF